MHAINGVCLVLSCSSITPRPEYIDFILHIKHYMIRTLCIHSIYFSDLYAIQYYALLYMQCNQTRPDFDPSGAGIRGGAKLGEGPEHRESSPACHITVLVR